MNTYFYIFIFLQKNPNAQKNISTKNVVSQILQLVLMWLLFKTVNVLVAAPAQKVIIFTLKQLKMKWLEYRGILSLTRCLMNHLFTIYLSRKLYRGGRETFTVNMYFCPNSTWVPWYSTDHPLVPYWAQEDYSVAQKIICLPVLKLGVSA